MARAAFGGAQEAHALDSKFHSDERIQIQTRRDDVASRDAGRLAADAKFAAQFIKDFRCEEGDLALVIVFEIKETVTFDAASGHATNFRALDQRVFARQLALSAKKIMAGRNVKVADFHGGNMTTFGGGENLFAPSASLAGQHFGQRFIDVNALVLRERGGGRKVEPVGGADGLVR